VINNLFIKTMQKLSAKHSKGGLYGISEKRGPETTASIASPNIHPDYTYIIFQCKKSLISKFATSNLAKVFD